MSSSWTGATSGNDTFTGTAGADIADGLGGDDSLAGGEGDDRLLGNAGADTLSGGDGDDTLSGDEGDDLLLDAGDGGLFDGGAGMDTLQVTTRGFYAITRGPDGTLAVEFRGDAADGEPLSAATAERIERFATNEGFFDLTDPGWDGTETLFVCFAAGTRIMTATGEVPVERLRPGHRVLTLGGRGLPVKPVIWVGRRQVMLAGHPRAAEMAPIRIRAGALEKHAPLRDLLVSPDHCLYLDGVLVPARLLVNGTTITAETGMAAVTWYHVELETHEILVADGAAAESWLDCGNRAWFENARVSMMAVPGNLDDSATGFDAQRACKPVVQGGPRLAAIRAAIEARAAELSAPAAPASTLVV